MKSVCLWLAAIIVTALPVRAIDLGAPAVKHVTIASEIKRGFDGARYCCAIGKNLGVWRDTFGKMIFENQQRNTDTDAYLMGAYFGFSYLAATTAPPTKGRDKEPIEIELARVFGELFCVSEFHKRQRALGITDEELMKVLSIELGNFRMWKQLTPKK